MKKSFLSIFQAKHETEDERRAEAKDAMKNASGAVRKRILFQGNVQFVGFRFQSKTIADALGLTGFVENLSDGDVLMEVQGSERTIEELIDALHQRRPIRIDSMEIEYLPLKTEQGFRYVW